jgi:hypothetical protein
MSGKPSRLKALESRKQLLIAESELNRAQMTHEWRMMAVEFHALARKAKTFSVMASAAGLLVAALSLFRNKKSAATTEKPSWWQTLLKGVGVVGSLWSVFRSQDHVPEDK